MTEVRKGQAPDMLARDEFGIRFRRSFDDPAFDAERDAITRLEDIAWSAYHEERKSPRKSKAGAGFRDPDYEMSIEWRDTKQRLERAQAVWADAATPSRVLVICGSPRNDGSCPGGISRTFRLATIVRDEIK